MNHERITSLFPSLEKDLIEEMSAVAAVRELSAGDVLMRTGQNIRSALLVLDGIIKIFREDDQGNEFFMYYLDAGKACAISLVCGLGLETSGLMAKAETDAVVLGIPVQYVDSWMGKYKSWAHFAVRSYRERFDELLQTIDQIAFRNMDDRVVFHLKRLQQRQKSNLIYASMTEIAQDLNSSREVISRLMKKLSERGIVKLHRSHIEIIDLDKAWS